MQIREGNWIAFAICFISYDVALYDKIKWHQLPLVIACIFEAFHKIKFHQYMLDDSSPYYSKHNNGLLEVSFFALHLDLNIVRIIMIDYWYSFTLHGNPTGKWSFLLGQGNNHAQCWEYKGKEKMKPYTFYTFSSI